MKRAYSVLLIVVLLGMFSVAWADTDQVTFSITVQQNLPDWGNLQFPVDTTVALGDSCTFYAQVWEDGKTTGEGQFADINAWIGYSSSNTDPSGSGWTWISATYNAAASSEGTNSFANDEYYAELGSLLPVGTYYVTSRFAFEGDSANAVYGGYAPAGGEHGLWDGTDVVSGEMTIVKLNTAPIIAAITNKLIEEDSHLAYVLSASDADDDTLTFSVLSNDQSSDIILQISGDTLNITPNADFFTTTPANVVIQVSDGHGGTDTTSFTITVDAVNDAPVIASVVSPTILEGVETTITFTATDVDNIPSELTWSQTGKPEGSVFTDLGDGTATLVWTPNYTQSGTYNDIVITVNDNQSSSRSIIIKTGKKRSK